MNPKKAKELIKPTANELGFSDSLVKDITDFYWENLRKALGDLRAPNIYIAGLGTMNASSKKLFRLQETYKAMIEKNETDTFKKYSDIKNIESKLDNVHNVFSMIRDRNDKKKQVKQLRYGKSDNTPSNQEL